MSYFQRRAQVPIAPPPPHNDSIPKEFKRAAKTEKENHITALTRLKTLNEVALPRKSVLDSRNSKLCTSTSPLDSVDLNQFASAGAVIQTTSQKLTSENQSYIVDTNATSMFRSATAESDANYHPLEEEVGLLQLVKLGKAASGKHGPLPLQLRRPSGALSPSKRSLPNGPGQVKVLARRRILSENTREGNRSI